MEQNVSDNKQAHFCESCCARLPMPFYCACRVLLAMTTGSGCDVKRSRT